MIIFFDKETGNIVGSAMGRTHSEEEKKMWVGDPKEVDRIVVEWKPMSWKKEKDGRKIATVFEPDCDKDLKPILEEVEKEPMLLHKKYKFDVGTGKLREKTKEEIEQQEAEAKKRNDEALKKKERRNNLIKTAFDKQKPLEERFNSLVEVLNIKEI